MNQWWRYLFQSPTVSRESCSLPRWRWWWWCYMTGTLKVSYFFWEFFPIPKKMLQHPKNHRHLGEGNWSSVPCHGFALTFLSVYDIEGLYNVFTNDTWKYLNMSNDFIFNSLPVMDRLIYFMSLFSSFTLLYGARRCGRHCHHEPWIWWGFPSWQHLK